MNLGELLWKRVQPILSRLKEHEAIRYIMFRGSAMDPIWTLYSGKYYTQVGKHSLWYFKIIFSDTVVVQENYFSRSFQLRCFMLFVACMWSFPVLLTRFSAFKISSNLNSSRALLINSAQIPEFSNSFVSIRSFTRCWPQSWSRQLEFVHIFAHRSARLCWTVLLYLYFLNPLFHFSFFETVLVNLNF